MDVHCIIFLHPLDLYLVDDSSTDIKHSTYVRINKSRDTQTSSYSRSLASSRTIETIRFKICMTNIQVKVGSCWEVQGCQ